MSNSDGQQTITITIISTSTGQSDSISVLPGSTTANDLIELSKALLGLDGNSSTINIYKDGKSLTNSSNKTNNLQQLGIVNGDLIAIQQQQQSSSSSRQQQTTTTTTTTNGSSVGGRAVSGGGGLDFSSLLGGSSSSSQQQQAASSGGGGGGLDFSSLLGGSGAAPSSTSQQQQSTAGSAGSSVAIRSTGKQYPIYYDGMSLDDAIEHNPHPDNFASVLLSNESLMKELNYHNPTIVTKIQGKSLKEVSQIWREELVKGGIKNAFHQTQKYHKEQEFTNLLKNDPNNQEAKEYFSKQENQKLINLQYQQMMMEYPESMGRVLMLYISAQINDTPIQAFVDSGAQSTIMSASCARRCGLYDVVDTRFAGTAVGVGTGKILGRIHIVSLKIGTSFFPCSVTVMDDSQGLGDKNMDFLLGLDMLKRHTCSIDLENYCLKFRIHDSSSTPNYMITPFLHEKDLDETKGGTKGFDVEKANKEVEERIKKAQEERESKESSGGEGSHGGDDDEKKKKDSDNDAMEEG